MRIKKISISGQFDCEEYDEKNTYIYIYIINKYRILDKKYEKIKKYQNKFR